MIRKLRKLNSLRTEYIEGAEKKLLRGLSMLEKELIDKIFDSLIDRFNTNRGALIYDSENFGLLPSLDKIIEEFRSSSYLGLFSSHANDYLEIANQTNSFFKIQVTKNQYDKLSKRVTKTGLKSVGLTDEGKLIKGGFLDSFYNSDQINAEIKRVIIKNINGESKLSELRKELIDNIVTTKEKNGLLRRHWRQNAFDTQQQFNRNHAKVWANEVGMTACEYSAGTVRDSRIFCVDRVGKVFLKSELSEWNSLVNKKETRNGKRVFTGPIMANGASYSPEVDCGGINCQHNLMYISDDLAISIDGSLSLKDGKLVRG